MCTLRSIHCFVENVSIMHGMVVRSAGLFVGTATNINPLVLVVQLARKHHEMRQDDCVNNRNAPVSFDFRRRHKASFLFWPPILGCCNLPSLLRFLRVQSLLQLIHPSREVVEPHAHKASEPEDPPAKPRRRK